MTRYPKPGPRKKRKKIKDPLEKEYADLLKYCDNLWKELVLKRDKNIDHYRMKPAQQAHHIISRYYWPTRWLLLNGLSLAKGSHCYDAHGKGTADFNEWIRNKWLRPEQYNNLLQRKNNRMKRCVETLRVVKMSLDRQKDLI